MYLTSPQSKKIFLLTSIKWSKSMLEKYKKRVAKNKNYEDFIFPKN